MHPHFILLDTADLHTSSSSCSHISQNTLASYSFESTETNLLRNTTIYPIRNSVPNYHPNVTQVHFNQIISAITAVALCKSFLYTVAEILAEAAKLLQ